MKAGFLIAAASVCVGLAAGLSGCASAPRASDQVITWQTSQPTIPLRAEVRDVPFIDQAVGHCGPATLAMTSAWAGKPVDVQQLASQVITPVLKGSLQTDMVSAARRNGFLAVPIKGFEALVQEISAGHPVIVFENLGLSWYEQWHYAVVLGYDLQKKEVLLHSGSESRKIEALRVFEHSWNLGSQWGLVVLPPGKLSASAPELAQATAASALEQLGHLDAAKRSYLAILDRWPESLSALVGLGNVLYTQEDFAGAVKYLRRARAAHPQVPAVAQNLEVAESALARPRTPPSMRTRR